MVLKKGAGFFADHGFAFLSPCGGGGGGGVWGGARLILAWWALIFLFILKEAVGWVVNLNSFLIAVVRLCLNKQALQLTLKLIKPVGLIVILHSQHNGV